jgi:uncharacterized repeat protein (TIGR01451 family)
VDSFAYGALLVGTTSSRFKNATWGMPQDTDAASDVYTSTSPTPRAPNDRTRPAITVEKVASAAFVQPGGTATYTIWYNNTGDGNARHVWVNDTLPAGMAYQSSSVPYSTNAGQTYGWHFTHVAPGTHSLTLTASVGAAVPPGTLLTNNVQLSYTDQLSRPMGSSSDSFTVEVRGPTPVLSISKVAESDVAYPGAALAFTIWYNNTGSGPAPHVWVNDTLPALLTFQSASPAPSSVSGQDVSWHFTDVAPGTNSIGLVVAVSASAPFGAVISNTAVCEFSDSAGATLPPVSSTDAVTVANPAARIVLNEVSSEPNPEWVELCNPTGVPVNVGGWSIQYRQGLWQTAYTIPAGTFIGAWGSGSEYLALTLPANSLPNNGRQLRLRNSAGTTVDTTAYPDVEPGQTWSRLKHEDTGMPVDTGSDTDWYVSNDAWIVPEGPTPAAPNDRKRPVMQLQKAVNTTVAEPGQTLIYTLSYANAGDGNAKAVWVNDTLPAGVTFVSASPAPDLVTGQDLSWYFNSIVHGSSGTISVIVMVNSLPADGESVVNAAALTYHDALRMPMGTLLGWANFTCARPVIAVEKVSDVQASAPGGTIVYTIYYNNTGSAPAGAVWVNDTLPAGVTFVSASPAPGSVSGQMLAWQFSNVAPGAHSITVTVTVNATQGSGTLTNWAYLDYASRYGLGLEQSSDSASVVIPEMAHIALTLAGVALLGIIALQRRRMTDE